MEKNKKLKLGILLILFLVSLSSNAFADLYLNSKTGYINLNTTGQTRLQITPGGNLNLLGVANVSISGNLSVGGNISVDGSTLFVDSESNRIGIGTASPQADLHVSAGSALGSQVPTTWAGLHGGRFGRYNNNQTSYIDCDGTGTCELSTYDYAASTGINLTINGNAGGNIYMVQNGGSVGIGTTSPARKLEVQGSVPVRFSFDASGTYYEIQPADADGTVVLHYAANGGSAPDLAFTNDANTEIMRLTNAGSVGIGTASPGQLLHVQGGDILINKSSGDANLRLDSGSAADDDAQLLIYNNSVLEWVVGVDTSAGNIFRWEEREGSSSDVLAIQQDGNVGIGTTSPASNLVVAGGRLQVTGTAVPTADAGLELGGGSIPKILAYNRSGSASLPLEIEASRVFFANTNVGIGDPDPSEILEINHTSDATIRLIRQDADITANEIIGEIEFYSGDASIGSHGVMANIEAIAENGDKTDLRFLVGHSTGSGDPTLTEALRIKNTNGHVGIGTTTPSQLLDIAGAGASIMLNATSANPGIFFGNGSDNGIQGYIFYERATDVITLNQDGTSGNGLHIDNSNNVGIGTISPGAELDIEDTTSEAALHLAYNSDSIGDDTTVGNVDFLAGSAGTTISRVMGNTDGTSEAGGHLVIETRADGGSLTEKMRVEGNGNVGIGTTSPGALLHVASSAHPVGNFSYTGGANTGYVNFDGTNGAGGGNMELRIIKGPTAPNANIGFYNGSTVDWEIGTGITNTDDNFRFYDGASAVMTLEQGGNIGIGTTYPSTKLNIVDSSFMIVHINSSSSNGARMDLESTSGNARYQLQTIGTGVAGREGNFEIQNFNTGTISIAISNSTGNLGIGTTSPSQKLDVVGGIEINDSIPRLLLVVNGQAADEKIWDMIASGTTLEFKSQNDAFDSSDNYMSVNRNGVTVQNISFYTNNDNERMRIDKNGNVGIATITPAAQLDVDGTGNLRLSGATNWGLETSETPAFQIIDRSTQVRRGVFDTSGNVYLGGSITGVTGGNAVMGIISTGNVVFPGLGSNGGENRYACIDSGTGNLTDKGSACSTSSIRFKENIRDSDYGLKEVMQLRQVRYNYKKEKDPDKDSDNIALKKDHIGFIAEEILEVLPELIYYDQDGNVDNIRYEAMPSILSKAIQEQQEMIEELKTIVCLDHPQIKVCN
jgi:hypothetical protein